MTGNYSFNTLCHQIKTQKSDFWRTSLYGIIVTLLLLPIPMLIPLLIDEVLLVHPGKMTEMISLFFGSNEVWLYIAVMLVIVLLSRFIAFFFNNKKHFTLPKLHKRSAICFVIKFCIIWNVSPFLNMKHSNPERLLQKQYKM